LLLWDVEQWSLIGMIGEDEVVGGGVEVELGIRSIRQLCAEEGAF
jgi:hypothetical protein